jgi:hypothetical protein
LRTAILACGASISNAFGALFASGILGSLEGTLGFSGWRSEPKWRVLSKNQTVLTLLQMAILCGGRFDHRGRGVCRLYFTRFSFNAERLASA